MSKKVKIPKIPDKELKELTQAVEFAYGNPAADEFFDEVMERALYYEKIFSRGGKRRRKG